MRCTQCDREVADDSTFCPHCGERLTPAVPFAGRASDLSPVNSADSNPAGEPQAHPSAAAERIRQEPTRFGSKDPQEEELWSGRFSPKAMAGQIVMVGLVSIAALVGVALFWNVSTGWLTFGAAMLVLWGGLGISVTYRRLSVEYRLTRFRFFHERGIISRVTDRIETIDIDDVTVFQGPLERMLGVGTIVMASTDRTSPELRMQGIDHVKAVADLIDSTRRAERQRRGLHLEAS